MITDDLVKEIKSRANLVDVVQDFVKLKKQGANYLGICPFHTEKTGSFTVSPAKQIYKCFGCGKSGDSIQFLIEHEKWEFLKAVEWLGQKYNISIGESNYKKEYKKPEPRLEKCSKKVIDWFENERKISNNTLLRFKITEAKEYMPQFEKEVNCICFNYYYNEELVNIKFRGPEKSFKLAKDAKLLFYNLDAIKDEKEVIIVEGEIDCLSAYEAKVYNVCSVPNGTPPADQKGNYSPKLEYLDNCWKDFEGKEKIIIATDNDYVGSLLREELARRLGKGRCYQVKYPEGCKDTNDVLKKFGPEAVRELLENSTIWPLEGIINCDDVDDTIDDWYENGYPTGAKSHVAGLDELLTFAPRLLTIITGIPGHGKDEYTNDILVGLARHEGWIFGIAAFEEDTEVSITKLSEKIVRKAFAFRSNPESRMNRTELQFAKSLIRKHFFFINVNEVDISIDGIIKKGEELVNRKGINGLVINPWNCIEHNIPAGLNETSYISQALTKLINFGRRCNVHIFLIAHPTKMGKSEKTGKYFIPTLYSISGSSNFFAKTHNGICVYRDYDTNITDVYIQKVKFYWQGAQGFNTYMYDTDTRQYFLLNTTKMNAGLKPIALGKTSDVKSNTDSKMFPELNPGEFDDNVDPVDEEF